jgi:hypothetical protein
VTARTDWPYDADRDDPLTALRIPVTCSWPEWSYIASFDRDSDARPTDAEAAVISSFIAEYIGRWYNDTLKARLAKRPFDIDGGANGTIFRKYGEGDWGYRKASWRVGPLFLPSSPLLREKYPDENPLGPHTLVQVIDREYTMGDDGPREHWVQWKADHPDVFGGVR